ncbi:omega-hydroxypalmitate O-feruloyl transferase [Apostasia shenzhenica]|uniref:Omega-hydroxypalmitate O-feruloyl transferase n=1 Tax=Apostasia shenzhenica TaxID=1088818 RepID=A0A2I0A3M1_9ASPA|nr:omega-hydroxypalmitate O-feruloyl transferase [Apostasia shenzhenica]
MADSELTSESKTAIMGNGSGPPDHISREVIAENKDGSDIDGSKFKNDGVGKIVVEDVSEIEKQGLEGSKNVVDKGTEEISNKNGDEKNDERNHRDEEENKVAGEVKDGEENKITTEAEDVYKDFPEPNDGQVQVLLEDIKSDYGKNVLEVGKEGGENEFGGDTEKLGEKLTTKATGDEIDVDLKNNSEKKDAEEGKDYGDGNNIEPMNGSEGMKHVEAMNYDKQYIVSDKNIPEESFLPQSKGDDGGAVEKTHQDIIMQEIGSWEKKETIDPKDEMKASIKEVEREENNTRDAHDVEEENDGDGRRKTIGEKRVVKSLKRKRAGQSEDNDVGEVEKTHEDTNMKEAEGREKETIDWKGEEKASIQEVEQEEDGMRDAHDVGEENDGGGRHKTIGKKRLVKSIKRKRGGRQRTSKKHVQESGKEDVEKVEDVCVKGEAKSRTIVEEVEEDDIEEIDDFEDEHNSGDEKMKANDKVEIPLKNQGEQTERTYSEGEVMEKGNRKEKNESGKMTKDLWISPVAFSRERPVRERKTVERLVEVIEKEPNRAVIIEKGRGTPLKEIPNVAYKLARKKPADLKFLHQTLFGRKGKAVDFKSNLLQFSGFAWHESEEKQRAKIKEKFDKCTKDALLDLCDLFDLTVSRTSTRKDEIIIKLLDFMEVPQVTADVILFEEQSASSRKRKRGNQGSASKGSGGTPKKSTKKRFKGDGTPNSKGKYSHDREDEDDNEEEDDTENNVADEDVLPRHTGSDAKEIESEEAGDDSASEDEGDELDKGIQVRKKSPKHEFPAISDKRKAGSSYKKAALQTVAKSPERTPSSKNVSVEKSDDTAEKHFSRKKKDADLSKRSYSKANSKYKSSGDKASKEKASSAEERKSGPTKMELRNTICQILKEVDFNTATFTDILKQLGKFSFVITVGCQVDTCEILITPSQRHTTRWI